MKIHETFLFLLFFCGWGGWNTLNAQTVLWSEDFTYTDGTTTGADNNLPTGPDWTATCPSCASGDWLEVRNNQLEGHDTNGPATWESEVIDISTAAGGVEVSMAFSETGDMEACSDCPAIFNCFDYIKVEYSLDGAPYVSATDPGGVATCFAEGPFIRGGDFTDFVYTLSCLKGNSLRLRVTSATWAGGERIMMDDVEVRTMAPLTRDVVANSCGPFTFYGNTYSTSGTYAVTVTNPSGCDSTINLDLTLGTNTSETIDTIACTNLLINGQTYTTSGTYTQTLVNATGCDSILTINYTRQSALATTIDSTSCTPIVFDGNNISTSGTYTATFISAAGCDSVVTLNFTRTQADAVTIDSLACGSIQFDGNTLSASGTYTATFKNTGGCDSVVTLNLTIQTVDTSLTQSSNTLMANASGATYQWVNCADGQTLIGETNRSFTASQSGSFAVEITENGCTARSSCYDIISDFAMPTVFTPNNDGENDRFRPVNLDPTYVKTFRIYNRFGKLVYDNASWTDGGWNGTYEGEILPGDVFIYVLEYKFLSANEYTTYRGEVLLLR